MTTYEIYTSNDQPVDYNGSMCEAGTIDGWKIKLVATDKDITTYPYFDCIITKNDVPVSQCQKF